MTKNKQLFAEWLAIPKEMREPRTQKEFAVQLNVQPETLSRWKKDPALQDQVYEVARAYLENRLPEIMHGIGEKAAAGEYKFVILALELTGRYNQAITVRTDSIQVGIEKYSAVIRRMEEWERERFGSEN